MGNAIRVGNLFGIPFFIDPSWFLVLGLVTFSYGSDFARFPDVGGALPWLLGLVTALLLFASVLAHELGHSMVALRQGIGVRSITLFIFGGLASLEKESDSPGNAFWVAVAGPAVSFVLCAVFLTVSLTVPLSGPLGAIINLLGYINLALGVFNLIPGLPLDGGNVLKAAVWKFTDNPYRGTLIASRVGQAIGWIGVTLGIMAALGITQFGSIWLALIGFFLLQNAGRSAQSASLQERLSDFTAEDAVTPNSPIVSQELTLREFANNYVIGKNKWQRFLVVDDSDRLIGTLHVDDLRDVPTMDWPRVAIRELMRDYSSSTVASNKTLLEAIMLLDEQNQEQLPVVREDGVLLGLLEKTAIVRLLQGERQEAQQPS